MLLLLVLVLLLALLHIPLVVVLVLRRLLQAVSVRALPLRTHLALTLPPLSCFGQVRSSRPGWPPRPCHPRVEPRLLPLLRLLRLLLPSAESDADGADAAAAW